MYRTIGILGAAAAALTISTAANAQSSDCGEVSITQMDWASAEIVTETAAFLMEQGYGCKVTKVPSSTDPAITSLAETGKPDIATELWTNNKPQYFDLRDSGKVREATNVLSDGGVEGWWIPTYLAEEHPELTTMEGILANPELVGGRFHNCTEGWACRTVNDNLIKAWDMRGQIEIFDHGSGETLATSIASAYEDKEPWFGYYWAPTSILGQYDMTAVDIGEFNQENFECNQSAECPNPGKSAYPPSTVVTATTNDFAETHPEVFELLTKVSFTNDQMGELLAWMEDNKASAEEAAVYFLSNNSDVWSEWVSDSAREQLSSLIQ